MPTQISRFTTGTLQDTLSPVMTSVNPANGSSNLLRSTPITITFNEPIDPSSFNADNAELRRAAGFSLHPVTYSISADGLVLTMTPNGILNGFDSYIVIIKPGLRDLAGNGTPTIGGGSGGVSFGNEIRSNFSTGGS